MSNAEASPKSCFILFVWDLYLLACFIPLCYSFSFLCGFINKFIFQATLLDWKANIIVCTADRYCNLILFTDESQKGKPHFKQLFALKGNYNEGFGTEKHSAQWIKGN